MMDRIHIADKVFNFLMSKKFIEEKGTTSAFTAYYFCNVCDTIYPNFTTWDHFKEQHPDIFQVAIMAVAME